MKNRLLAHAIITRQHSGGGTVLAGAYVTRQHKCSGQRLEVGSLMWQKFR
jgi:hypothetical protein